MYVDPIPQSMLGSMHAYTPMSMYCTAHGLVTCTIKCLTWVVTPKHGYLINKEFILLCTCLYMGVHRYYCLFPNVLRSNAVVCSTPCKAYNREWERDRKRVWRKSFHVSGDFASERTLNKSCKEKWSEWVSERGMEEEGACTILIWTHANTYVRVLYNCSAGDERGGQEVALTKESRESITLSSQCMPPSTKDAMEYRIY